MQRFLSNVIFKKVENKASVPQSINDDLYDEVNHSLELELTSHTVILEIF